MANSYVQYPGDGVTVLFTIPFGYLDRSHVTVKVNGVVQTLTTNYSYLSATQIQFVVAPAAALIIDIRRSTPKTALVTFQDASGVTANDLNTATLQELYIAQETIDTAGSSLALDSLNRWDALSHRIINVTDGTGAQDAVTLAQLAAATLSGAGVVSSIYAPLASPTFTGTPALPTGTTGVTQAAGDSSTKLATTAFVASSTVGHGQCQLQYVGTTSIKLMPFNGNLLKVNGTFCTVPDAGITLANTGLTQATLYYIYATQSAGAINALEASTTVPVVDTTAGNKGVKIKTGDPTRTLVGMVYMNTGVPGLFGSSTTFQGVRSWFNDPGMAGNNGLAADKSTTSATYVKMDSTTDITFLAWASELVNGWASGVISPAGGGAAYAAIGVDGTTPEDAQLKWSAGTLQTELCLATPPRALSEGAHTASLLGASLAGATMTMHGAAATASSTPTVRTTFGVRSSGVNP